MAIYHLHAQIIGRSSGRSSVAAAAYRAGVKITNERDGITHDYTRKQGIAHTEIILPQNAPLEFADRYTLWNAVEQAEKRRDAQTAREMDIALPLEFDHEEQIELIREYVRNNFTDQGMCADIAIHDKGDGNPHAHVMLTTRHISPDGFGGKNRDWNNKALLESWRESWADICNERFKQKRLDIQIDHRTLDAQGIDREPTIHTGLSSSRRAENAAIIQRNEMKAPEKMAEYIHELKQGYVILDREIAALKHSDSQENIAHLANEKETIKVEYQRQKLLAELRSDWQRIVERLKELAKEARSRIQSVREDLQRRKAERMLDTVTERSFGGVLKKVLPRQSRALQERRGIEGTREEIELNI